MPSKKETAETPSRPVRKGKLTADAQRKFLKLFASGHTAFQAAHAIGTSRTAIFDLRARNPKFEAAYVKARERMLDTLEDSMHHMALNGNITAMFGLLRAFRPLRWRENVDVSGKVQHEHTFPAAFAQAMADVTSGKESGSSTQVH